MKSPRKIAGLLTAVGVGLGLLGGGVYAGFTDSGTATATQQVGTFACTVSSTDPNAVQVDSHTITEQLPAIQSSSGSASMANLSVKNSGSIPMSVYWTVTTSGDAAKFVAGSDSLPVGAANAVTMQPNAILSYGPLPFTWSGLTNADLNNSASVTYTATCGEVPPPPPGLTSVTVSVDNPGPVGLSLGTNGIAFTGVLTNVSVTPHLHSFTMQVPYTVSAGNLTCSMANAYMASAGGTGSCSTAGGVLTLTQNFASTVTGWTPGHYPGGTGGKDINLAYIGSDQLSGSPTVTFTGPVVITAAS